MHVLLVGYGNMGSAFRASWRSLEGLRVTIVTPKKPGGIDPGDHWVSSARGLPSAPDVIVFAVKPQTLKAILAEYAAMFPKALGVSIAAGVTLSTLKALSGGASFVRVMPNLPIRVGRGVCALQGDSSLLPIHRQQVETLVAQSSLFTWCETDDQMDIFTAVFGSGPGFILDCIMQYTQAAQNVGMSHDNLIAMIDQLFRGSVDLLSDKTAQDLCHEVTSPGGTTQAGLESLRAGGNLRVTFEKAFKRAIARARDLRSS